MATLDKMKFAAAEIKTETADGENTAERVGGLFEDIIDSYVLNGTNENDININASNVNVSSNAATNISSQGQMSLETEGTSNILLSPENGKVLYKGEEVATKTYVNDYYISVGTNYKDINVSTDDANYIMFSHLIANNTGVFAQQIIMSENVGTKIVTSHPLGLNLVTSKGIKATYNNKEIATVDQLEWTKSDW
ncbi:MAG: hypothetical protein ACLVKO_06905 [Dysgonomonas sp.]